MADLVLGSTTAMTESGGTVTLCGVTIPSGVTFPAGHVVAVYNDTHSEQQTGSGSIHTWYDSSLAITLTPVSVNSKFVIQGQWNQHCASNGSAMKIARAGATEPDTGSTLIGDKWGATRQRAGIAYSYQGFDANQRNPIAYCVYDDPNTASSITYKLQYMHEAGTYYINRSEGAPDAIYSYATVEVSTMTIFEISS